MRIRLLFCLGCICLAPLAADAGRLHDAARPGDVAALAVLLEVGADIIAFLRSRSDGPLP